ncbi:hypothetical protein Tco_0698407 [Tanacetum coccineum]
MEIVQVDFDELTTMASEQSSSGLALHEMTPGTLSSGLVPQPPSLTPFVPPTRNDWDTLFQPLFNDYFNPPLCVDHPVPKVAASEPAISTGTPSSTSVEEDAPSPIAHMDNHPYVGIPIPEPSYENPLLWFLFQIIPVSTQHQLQTDALFCDFDAFLSSVEPNSYKEALTESFWIESMQEELNEFERLLHEKFYNSLGNAPNRCSVVWARLGVVYRSLEE